MDRIEQENLRELLELDINQIESKLLLEISTSTESLDDFMTAAEQKICVEWSFCARREAICDKTEFELALMIADLLLSCLGQAPVTTLTAYLVKYGLEKLCKCD